MQLNADETCLRMFRNVQGVQSCQIGNVQFGPFFVSFCFYKISVQRSIGVMFLFYQSYLKKIQDDIIKMMILAAH